MTYLWCGALLGRQTVIFRHFLNKPAGVLEQLFWKPGRFGVFTKKFKIFW